MFIKINIFQFKFIQFIASSLMGREVIMNLEPPPAQPQTDCPLVSYLHCGTLTAWSQRNVARPDYDAKYLGKGNMENKLTASST